MEKIVEVKWEEIWPVVNVLNEVCHGININSHESEIGFRYEEILKLLRTLSQLEDKNENYSNQIIIKLSDNEREIIKNSFEEVFKQIEEWEFQTRIGITIQEANEIKKKLV